jgi:hypothetical protein
VTRATAAVVLAVGAVVATITACGGGGDALAGRARQAARVRADQARAAAAQAGLPGPVQQFVATAAGSSGQRYTVSYDLGGTPSQTATLVQRPPFRRFELADTAPGAAGTSAPSSGPSSATQVMIVNSAGSFACRRTDGQWSCVHDAAAAQATGPLSLDDLASTVNSLSASKDTYDFRVERRRLVGVAATCLVTTRKAGLPPEPAAASTATLCISPQGAPLLVSGGSAPPLQATSYSTTVASSAFTLPAAAS